MTNTYAVSTPTRKLISPLRYPGGKSALGPYLALAARERQIDTIVEPFAGGAGAGLYALSVGACTHLHLNDLNPLVADLWKSMVETPQDLIDLIFQTRVTVSEWHRQKAISENSKSTLESAFAALFLNRTNHGGFLRGRPIGGLAQTGKGRIDDRWNPDTLARRIRRIASLGSAITVSNSDGVAQISRWGSALLFVDPPYVAAGKRLYGGSRGAELEQLHYDLQLVLERHPNWILTYDADPLIDQLYGKHRQLPLGSRVRRNSREVILTQMGERTDPETLFDPSE